MNLRKDPGGVPKPVFLAGEGLNELGSWAVDPVYRSDDQPGVIEELLRAVKNHGWYVKGAVRWVDIKKYKAGDHRSAERRNVLGACQRSRELRCSVFAFSRDRDSDTERLEIVTKAIEEAATLFPDVNTVGGCAVPSIEGWVLAFAGVKRTEMLSRAKAASMLQGKGVQAKNTQQMVAFVKGHSCEDIADDAKCLVGWIRTARGVL